MAILEGIESRALSRGGLLDRSRTWKQIKKHWQLYLLISLPILYIILFKYVPMYGLTIGFKDYWPAKGITGSPWAGFKHFKAFFSSPYFAQTVRNTIVLNVLGLTLSFPVPILFALSLNEARSMRFRRSVQLITYAPHFISTVIIVQMLMAFLSPRTGLVNHMIRALGGEPVNFMAIPQLMPFLYVFSGVWQNFGFNAIIYIAALSAIDPELYESAYIDGANRLQKILHIDIPGILPTIIILFILRTGKIMTIGFEKVFLMQNPLNLASSEIISTFVYKVGIQGIQYSFGAAVDLFNSAVNLLLILSINRIARRVSRISLW